MTENVSKCGMEPFENPKNLPLEELKLKVKTDGVIQFVPALNKLWVKDRYFLHYEPPIIYNDDGSEIIGAKEYWLEIISYINDDLRWLLKLPFHKFWSNIMYNPSIMDTVISFLQEAPPFYAAEDFPNIPEMIEHLKDLRKNVLVLFARLVINKASDKEYMSDEFFGELLYNNYIFTVPIIFDLCQLYGRDNPKIMEDILRNLFTLQPFYYDDLQKSVPCLEEALDNVEKRFEKNRFNQTNTVISNSGKQDNVMKITLPVLEDMLLYILDISSTLSILLKNYPPIAYIFHDKNFMNKIVSIYANTIPGMYVKLKELICNDKSMPKYMELKHRLDVTRVELLFLYRTAHYTPIEEILHTIDDRTEDEIKKQVEEYISILTNAIEEKEFITDYHRLYPIDNDFDILQQIYPSLDTINCEFVLQVVHSTVGTPKVSSASLPANTMEPVAGPSGIQNNRSSPPSVNNNSTSTQRTITKHPVELASLVSGIKDILGEDFEDRFIELCLKHYDYNTEAVINAILENTVPSHLKHTDTTLPYIPPDPMDEAAALDLAMNVQRLNIDEYDKFNNSDMSQVHRGKRKDKYKNINELLNDKTDVKKASGIYNKYSIVVDEYDDEYDDTYDSIDVGDSVIDNADDVKPFTTPRVLSSKEKNESSSDSEPEADDNDNQTYQSNGRNNFVRNPAEIRERNEQRQQYAHRGRTYHNATGKFKGQGHDKSVQYNRNQKAIRGSHNRRAAAQYKRNQSMIPS